MAVTKSLAWPHRVGALIKHFEEIDTLAEQTGVEASRWRLFRDERAEPTLKELEQIVRRGGVNPAFLLVGEGSPLGTGLDTEKLAHAIESVEAELPKGTPEQKAQMTQLLYRNLASFKPSTSS